MNTDQYDVVSMREDVDEIQSHTKYPKFVRALITTSTNLYPTGSIFLVIRRRRTTRVEFGDITFKREFEEIVLSPDGKVGTIDSVSRKKIA